MKDLAFAVSPGSHTLAAIKITKVSLIIIEKHCNNFLKNLLMFSVNLSRRYN